VSNADGGRTMFELLFLVIFIMSFVVFGISLLSVAVVIGVSIVFSLLMGMLGLMIKMLPWLIVIGLIIVWARHQRVR
jgi:phage shock protein G